MAEEQNTPVENENNEEEKKSLMVWIAEHPKTTFAVRAIAWAVFAAVLPFVFIAYRYGIFKAQNRLALSGWGILAVIIVAAFLIGLLGYLKQGMKEGMAKQCIMGFCKIVVPLIMVMVIVKGIQNNIGLFIKALGVTITCEIIAIPINPFPEWLEKRRKEQGLEERESMFGALWDKFFAKKKENENG